jgi:hypothetical protein
MCLTSAAGLRASAREEGQRRRDALTIENVENETEVSLIF